MSRVARKKGGLPRPTGAAPNATFKACNLAGQDLQKIVTMVSQENALLNQIAGPRLMGDLLDEFNAKRNVLVQLQDLPPPTNDPDVDNARKLAGQLNSLAESMRLLNDSLDRYVRRFGLT